MSQVSEFSLLSSTSTSQVLLSRLLQSLLWVSPVIQESPAVPWERDPASKLSAYRLPLSRPHMTRTAHLLFFQPSQPSCPSFPQTRTSTTVSICGLYKTCYSYIQLVELEYFPTRYLFESIFPQLYTFSLFLFYYFYSGLSRIVKYYTPSCFNYHEH